MCGYRTKVKQKQKGDEIREQGAIGEISGNKNDLYDGQNAWLFVFGIIRAIFGVAFWRTHMRQEVTVCSLYRP